MLFGPDAIHEVLERIDYKNIEITLEANPEGVSKDLIKAYHQAGINRISLGVQSLDDAELVQLGRSHTAPKAVQAVETIHQSGIENISIDLMYDVPGQTLKSWQHTVNQAVKLPISHLSLYNLTFEPQTVFYKFRERLQPTLPDEETSTDMLSHAVERFEAAGLKRYEISAFGKPSQHNLGYWQGRPFLGLGPSAFSYWEGRRFRCTSHLGKYLKALQEKKSPYDFEETLDKQAQQRELLTIGLRVLEGVDLDAFEVDLAPIERLIKKGFLTREGQQLRLTSRGMLFYDFVASELV